MQHLERITTSNETHGAHSNYFLSIVLKVDVFDQVVTNEESDKEVNQVKKKGCSNEKKYPRRSMPHQGDCPIVDLKSSCIERI